MINIQISSSINKSGLPHHPDRTSGAPIDPGKLEALLERTASEVLRYSGNPPEVEVTLVITGDDQLRELNRDFRGIDSPTDVLAFPGGDKDLDTGSLYLGDVIISYQHARVQSVSARHSIEDELRLLVVHGMLHLLGYDHTDEASKKAMWRTQDDILLRTDLTAGIPNADNPDFSVKDESLH